MVKFTSNNILATLVVFAYASLASAVPSELKGRDTDRASAPLTLCVDPEFGRCKTFPVVADTCRSFAGSLSPFSKHLSSAKIPQGFSCTFFSNFACHDDEKVTLGGGDYPFFGHLPQNGRFVNFNDKASAVTCSRLH